MVQKLLSKAAEERYQTAIGLQMDLRYALRQLEETGRIETFVLATRDVPDNLRIPDRLYGRSAEVNALLDAFNRVLTTGRSELILVEGPSGVGKSATVVAFSHQLPPDSSLFASGKFDRWQSGIPYRTLSAALGGLVNGFLTGSEEEVEAKSASLRNSLQSDARFIVNLVPPLASVLGEHAPGLDLPAPEVQARLWLALKRFLDLFARDDRPLVLFLDDLQWVDVATLEMVRRLVLGHETRNLLIVGAVRGGEVATDHPLAAVMETISDAGVKVPSLHLGALDADSISDLLSDALRSERNVVMPLAALIGEKTLGNAFFVHQFLRRLAHDALLTYSTGEERWIWDLDRIAARDYTENVADLVTGNIEKLDGTTLSIVQVLSCLGNNTASDILAQAADEDATTVRSALAATSSARLTVAHGERYAFTHDRVREAAYRSIARPAALHAKIGLRLAGERDWTADDGALFEVVAQLNQGAGALGRENRVRLAKLNAAAGARARQSAAYSAALAYLGEAQTHLDQSGDEGDHALGFSIALQRAECEFLVGDVVLADERLDDLAKRTTTWIEGAAVAWLRVTLDTAAGRLDRAVDTALVHLRGVGIHWSAKPERAIVLQEFRSIARIIEQNGVEALINLPGNVDEQSRTTLDMLTALLPPAFFTDNNLVCLVLCRMANLSLEHGHSDASSLAYAYLGMILGSEFGDYDAAYRFGRLGLDLVRERGYRRYAARVALCFGAHVIPYTQRLETARPYLREAFEAADRAGDLTYAGFSSCSLITNLLGAGTHLATVQREAESKLAYVRQAKFGLIVKIIVAQLQLSRALAGLTPDLRSLDDEVFDENEFERQLDGDPELAIAACWYWIRKAQHRCVVGDFAASVSAADKAEPLLWTTGGHFEFAEFHLYAALARAGAWAAAEPDEKVRLKEAIERSLSELSVWADSCAATFAHRETLVRGELARISGRDVDALRLYEQAETLARAEGCDPISALALECSSRLCRELGLGVMADTYRRRARETYRRYGAEGKVRDLTDSDDVRLDRLGSQIGVQHVTGLADGDLATVVRTSRALSEELALDRLVRTLMVIALQYAGADRGLLIMWRETGAMIEAEARSSEVTVDVRLSRETVLSSDVPISVLDAAAATRRAVSIADAREAHPFSSDTYFVGHVTRSVLCIPLVKQTKVMGVIYLENSLLPGTFTSSREAVLQLMASQAAISLENASLGEKEALLKEVHHRVKNNLQLVSSLLNLQAAQIADPKVAELFADSRNRVRSMALVHENLYRAGNFSFVVMKEHVQGLCAHLMRAYGGSRQGVNLDVDVADDIRLDVDRAVSCGLIINELVSNALKHAFPGRTGRIVVAMHLKSSHRCILIVSDDGIGLPIGTTGQGTLGLQIVHDLAEQLGGSVNMLHDGGTAVTLSFPASRGGRVVH